MASPSAASSTKRPVCALMYGYGKPKVRPERTMTGTSASIASMMARLAHSRRDHSTWTFERASSAETSVCDNRSNSST